MHWIRPCHTGRQTRFTNWPAPALPPARGALSAPSASSPTPNSLRPKFLVKKRGNRFPLYMDTVSRNRTTENGNAQQKRREDCPEAAI